MSIFDLIRNTAVRVVVLPIAIVHDTATMGGAVNGSESMVGRIIKDTVKDADKVLREAK